MRTNLWPNPRNLPADSSQSWAQWSILGGGTLANSTAKWFAPVQTSVLVTWANPTAANGANAGATLTGLTVGAVYTASVWVFVPSGSPAVQLNAYFLQGGATSTVNDQWQRLSVTFTANATTQFVCVCNTAAVSTAGTQVYVVGALCEAGTTVAGDYFDGGFLSGVWASDGTSTFAGTAAPRTNLCVSPVAFGSSTSGWVASAGTGGAATLAFGADSTAPTGYAITYKQTAAATAGNGYVYRTDASRGVAPNATYTFSAYVRPSVTLTLQALVNCYNSAGASIHAAYGPATTCPAGQLTQLTTTFTAPAGTMWVREFPFIGSIAPLPVGGTVEFSALLLEQASTVLPYFDGTDPNAAFVGLSASASPSPALACSQLQAGAQQNPNLPTMEVTAWPTLVPYGAAQPYAPGDSNLTGAPGAVVLSDRAVELSVSRGRQYELDTDQTGTAKVKLDNSDGAVSATLKPFNNIRAVAHYQGKAYDLFTGYMAQIPSKSETARNGYADVDAVDGMDMLANRVLRSALGEAILASSIPPERYFPLDDPAGSPGAHDEGHGTRGGCGKWAPIATMNGRQGATPAFGGQPVAVNGSSSFGLSNYPAAGTVSPTTTGTQLQIEGPQNRTGYYIDLTQHYAIEFAFAVTAFSPNFTVNLFSADDSTMSPYTPNGGPNPPSVQFSLVDNNNNGTQNLLVATSDFYLQRNFTNAQCSAGLLVALVYEGTQAHAIINGVIYPMVTNGPLRRIDARWICLGEVYSSATNFNTLSAGKPSPAVNFQHLAIWTAAGGGVPSYTDPCWSDHANALAGYAGETGDARVSRVAEWGGVAPNEVLTMNDSRDEAKLAAMQNTEGQAALATLQATAQGILGRFFIDGSGQPTYVDRYHDLTLYNPVAIFGSRDDLGEIPYTGMPSIGVDPNHTFNDVTATRDNGYLVRYVNHDSIKANFQRVLQVNTQVAYEDDLQDEAFFLGNRYSNPPVRVTALTVDLAANPSLIPQVLGLGIGNYVRLNHRVASGTETFELKVDKIDYVMSAKDGTFLVTFELTPYWRYWICAPMHTTFNAASAAGATTIVLNAASDASWSPAEGAVPPGTELVIGWGTPNQENVTVKAVTSDKPGQSGYSTITLTLTAAAQYSHASGDIVSEVGTYYAGTYNSWDQYSVIDQTTVPQW